MKKREMKSWSLPIAILVTVLVVAVIVLIVPADRGELLVKLLTGLEWLLVLLMLAIAFRPQIPAVADAIVDRVRQGAPIKAGGWELGSVPQLAAQIPSPAASEAVSLANIALLHTSFSRPDKTREFGDGRTYYQFEVIVMAPDDVFERIESVTYELERAWRDPVRTVTDPTTRFKLKELANGTSIVTAKIKLREQDQPVKLNRFIDLRHDGPRL